MRSCRFSETLGAAFSSSGCPCIHVCHKDSLGMNEMLFQGRPNTINHLKGDRAAKEPQHVNNSCVSLRHIMHHIEMHFKLNLVEALSDDEWPTCPEMATVSLCLVIISR